MSSPLWKVHFRSAPSEVYRALSTPLGRARYWAESAEETEGVIEFVLPAGRTDQACVERSVRDRLYLLRYGDRQVSFALAPDERGGTDLTLTCSDPAPGDATRWPALLLRLKAAVDHGVDLRNHHPSRTRGYVDS